MNSKIIPKQLLIEADNDSNLSGFVYPEKDLYRLPIEFENKVIGFATPRQEEGSVWRMGAIYIKPAYRGKGLAAKTIIDFMKDKKGRAYIENNNIASQRAYQKAGFKKMQEAKNKEGFWYQNFDKEKDYNDLVQFLIGKWENVSFEISDGKKIKKESYPETMLGKDFDTITITAHGFRDGEDLSKDMHLRLDGDQVTIEQGSFRAEGHREANVYYLKGNYQDSEFRFRLYTMGDKYVFHREIWKDGRAQQMDMSYLIRN